MVLLRVLPESTTMGILAFKALSISANVVASLSPITTVSDLQVGAC